MSAARALEKVGKKKWNKRVARILPILRRVVNFDHLYIGGGNARLIEFELPADVTIVPNSDGLTGGIALWRGDTPGPRRAGDRRRGAGLRNRPDRGNGGAGRRSAPGRGPGPDTSPGQVAARPHRDRLAAEDGGQIRGAGRRLRLPCPCFRHGRREFPFFAGRGYTPPRRHRRRTAAAAARRCACRASSSCSRASMAATIPARLDGMRRLGRARPRRRGDRRQHLDRRARRDAPSRHPRRAGSISKPPARPIRTWRGATSPPRSRGSRRSAGMCRSIPAIGHRGAERRGRADAGADRVRPFRRRARRPAASSSRALPRCWRWSPPGNAYVKVSGAYRSSQQAPAYRRRRAAGAGADRRQPRPHRLGHRLAAPARRASRAGSSTRSRRSSTSTTGWR